MTVYISTSMHSGASLTANPGGSGGGGGARGR